MALKDEILEFIKEVEYKIALHNKTIQEMEDAGKRNSTKYRITIEEMQELSMIARTKLISNKEIYDADDSEVVNFTIETDAAQRQFMSDVRVYYTLKTSPYADLPYIYTPYIIGDSAAADSSIPSGGLPDWYLTQNTSGSLYWKQLPSVIDGGEL